MAEIKRIAVWNTAFLGDAILTLPLLQSLKAAYPSYIIDFYVRKGLAPLFNANPHITTVYEFDKKTARTPASILEFGRRLQCREYDIWISAHQSPRSAIIARCSKAPLRIGYKHGLISSLCYTRTVDRCFEGKQEIERVLGLLEPLGIPATSNWPDLVLPSAALKKATEIFSAFGNAKVIAIHPGSVWATKRWPAEYYARLALAATGCKPDAAAKIENASAFDAGCTTGSADNAASAGVQVVLFAGPGEEEIAGQVRTAFEAKADVASKARFTDLTAELSLPELAACIGRLNCYVSNDSGPMHMAWAQHVPLVAIFGPTVTQLGFAPRGDSSVLLEMDGLKCRPCGLHGHDACPKGHHECMRSITPEMVWERVQTLL